MHYCNWYLVLFPVFSFLHYLYFSIFFVSINNSILRIIDANSKYTPPKSKKMRTEQKESPFQLFRKKAKERMIIFNHYVITYCFILFAFISTATDENKRPDWKMVFLFPENCTIKMIDWPSEISKSVFKDKTVNQKRLCN